MISIDNLFKCTQCGDCCKGFGGTYLTDEESQAIADYIETPVNQFVERYCAPSGRRLVLAQGKDAYCVFYSGNCTIHPVKPRMCREWPFIPSILVDIGNWYIMANSCPGMRRDVEEKRLYEYLHATIIPQPPSTK
jgi:Fe-S-cluster containining protein